MYKFFIVIILMLSSTTMAAEWQAASLANVEETVMHSKHSGQDYRIQAIAIGEQPADGYPVLYLLDGDFTLPLAALMMQANAFKPYYRQGIVLVGVGYANSELYNQKARSLDYTPPIATNDKHNGIINSGGADDFRHFLQSQLKPLITQRYQTDKTRQAIMGHSYGGLFALYSLFNYTDDFSAYLVSSPSIWWHNQAVLQDESKLSQAPAFMRITAAEYEQFADPNFPEDPQRLAKKQQRKMVDNAVALSQRLQKQFPNAAIDSQVYAKETHGSVIPRAVNDGIMALYRYWYPSNKNQSTL